MAYLKALVTNWGPYVAILTFSSIAALGPLHAANAQIPVQPVTEKIRFEAEGMWVNGKRWDATPNTAVKQGTVMKLSCTWSVKLVAAKYWKTDHDLIVPVVIKHNGAVVTSGTGIVPAGTWLGVKVTESGSVLTLNKSSTATNSPFGDRFRKELGPITWTATGGGMHLFQCELPEQHLVTETRVNVMHNVAPAEFKH